MMNFQKPILAAALCLGFSAPVWAQNVTGDTVVATVGGIDITVGHMIAMAESLPDDQRQLPFDVVFEGVLERLIQQEAIAQSLTDPSTYTQLELENERRSLLASTVVNSIADGIEVTEEDIQAVYDQRFADFSPPAEYNASHILVETEEAAQTIVNELADGADFSELAKLKSTGPSGPGGGELGWFGPGRMVPEFEAAVVVLEKGQVSAPVQTQFGWHVIILNDTRVPDVPTLDQMHGDLEQEVWQERLRAGVAALVESAEIVRNDVSGIDPQVLMDLALIEN